MQMLGAEPQHSSASILSHQAISSAWTYPFHDFIPSSLLTLNLHHNLLFGSIFYYETYDMRMCWWGKSTGSALTLYVFIHEVRSPGGPTMQHQLRQSWTGIYYDAIEMIYNYTISNFPLVPGHASKSLRYQVSLYALVN